MRQPFFVEGFQVDKENMQFVAEWCQGAIIPSSDGKSFIRVPVIGAKNARQTEAHIGMWVLKSMHGGRDTFKVYTEEWLLKTFVEVPGSNSENPLAPVFEGGRPEGGNVLPLPRSTPSPAMFSNHARVI
jgi:hypothetical protein